MGGDRKQVEIISESDTFNNALRLMLTGLNVSSGAQPSVDTENVDLVVWRFETDPPPDLARVAASVPTLALGPPEHLITAVDAGCRGFLINSSPLVEIENASSVLLSGGAVVPPDLLGTVLQHLVARRREQESTFELDMLTDREREVYDLAVAGMRRDEIGERLFISAGTVRTHLQRVYKKLGVHSQAELIAGSNSRTHGE